MSTSTYVNFWNNHGYGGNHTGFTAQQRNSYGTTQGWNSAKVGLTAWVLLWDDNDYKGNYLKLNPGSNTSNFDDLVRYTDSKGNQYSWKGAVKSMVIYGNEPSWWSDNDSIPPSEDLCLPRYHAVFSADTYFNDDTAVYRSDATVPDLNKVIYPTDTNRDMKCNISSLATGDSAWLQVWNGTNYSGDTLRVYPNTTYTDLRLVQRNPGGDWGDQIQSFKLYGAVPDGSWNLDFDEDKFFNSFPSAARLTDSTGPYYHYLTQDAGYDVRLNGKTFPDGNSMQLEFRVDFDVTGHNDKVDLVMVVKTGGVLDSVSYNFTQGSAAQVPPKLVKAVDYSAEAAGMLGLIETAGISEEAADEFIEDFDTFCDVFDKIFGLLYKIDQSSDGRFYMVAVSTHVLNRALAAVTVVH
jgi:hypothetical protein